MRRSLRGEELGNICIPIAETTMKDATKVIKEANRSADLIELRMHYLGEPGLAILLKVRQKRFIVSNHEMRDICKRLR
jgi:3-dehydroquinate dehydratase